MPISGLVITFESSFTGQQETLAQLREAPAIEVGAIENAKCAIVIDSASHEEDKRIYQWVHDLPGVANVQIAFVGFEDGVRDHHSSMTDSAD